LLPHGIFGHNVLWSSVHGCEKLAAKLFVLRMVELLQIRTESSKIASTLRLRLQSQSRCLCFQIQKVIKNRTRRSGYVNGRDSSDHQLCWLTWKIFDSSGLAWMVYLSHSWDYYKNSVQWTSIPIESNTPHRTWLKSMTYCQTMWTNKIEQQHCVRGATNRTDIQPLKYCTINHCEQWIQSPTFSRWLLNSILLVVPKL
jgi:hypothetical protein